MRKEKVPPLEAELHQLGYRITPQRQLILDVIRACGGHICAEHIHERVVERYPHVNISTVYRNLELLSNLGVLRPTDMGEGREEYELAERGAHHHLVCRRCGATRALDDHFLDELRRQLRAKYEFQASLEHLAFFGLCRECQDKPEEE